MNADLSLRLRALTQDYHEGRLNFTTYRSMRAALLDSLVSGAMSAASAAAAAAVAVTQPRTGSWTLDDAITRPGKPRVVSGADASAPGSAGGRASGASYADGSPGALAASGSARGESRSQESSGKRSPIVAIGIGVIVLVFAGIGVALWLGSSAPNDGSTSTAPTAADHGRIHQLLTQFTDRADWSDTHLASLNTDLLELGGASLSESASEPWFQRFVDEVRQRLKEQQALASTPLTANNSPLAALAVTVGLDLNAPDAAIHIAPLPPPRHLENTTAPDASGVKSGASSVVHTASLPTETDDKTRAAVKTSLPSAAETNDRTNAKSAATTAPTVGATSNKADSAATTQPDTHEGACRLELVGTRRPFCHDMLGASGPEAPPLALIPAGTFEMGSTAASEEQPVHRVTIRTPFAISINEVSQGEFKQFCAQTDRACPKQPWAGDDYPMVNVSWEDARAYTAWLSSITHHRYTLPSEAQWEYAARAGRTGLVPNGDALSPTDAHYSMLAKQTTAAPRGQKFNANAFRLLHTLGNVREWVEDAWVPNFAGAPGDGAPAAGSPSTTQRVARGGSYADGATRLRLSLREGLPASTRDATTGFRIVRELP